MKIISLILTLVVAIEHLVILYIEMFAWETIGKKVFNSSLKPDLFSPTKTLAANQGLYNGFLSAGLIWSLAISDANWSINIRLFFLTCIAIAGTYGALTASKKIFIIQALPAIVAIITSLII